MADQPDTPQLGSVISFLGRLVLSSMFIALALALASMLIIQIVDLPRSLGFGFFMALSIAVAMLGIVSIGPNPLRPVSGIVAGVVVGAARLWLCWELDTVGTRLVDTELALMSAYLIGTSIGKALPGGIWALRTSVGVGAFQFLYFRMGYGPGALGRLAFSIRPSDGLLAAWGAGGVPLTPRFMLGYGAQGLDLIYIAMVTSMALRGELRATATGAAVVVSALAAAILTSATGNPAPVLPWLAALLYLFQALEYDPLPPIERRSDEHEDAEAVL